MVTLCFLFILFLVQFQYNFMFIVRGNNRKENIIVFWLRQLCVPIQTKRWTKLLCLNKRTSSYFWNGRRFLDGQPAQQISTMAAPTIFRVFVTVPYFLEGLLHEEETRIAAILKTFLNKKFSATFQGTYRKYNNPRFNNDLVICSSKGVPFWYNFRRIGIQSSISQGKDVGGGEG